MRQLALAWLFAAVCLAGSGVAAAQTTTGRAESREITSRAEELLAAGNFRRAAQRFRHAIELDETNEPAYIGLSAALDSLGRYEEALQTLRSAESLIGWTPGIGVQRGIHLTRLERWDDAVASLERALDARPRSFDAAFYLARAQLGARRWEAAVAAYDRYLEVRPDSLANRDATVKTRRAYALIAAGELDRARESLEALLADDPERASAKMLLFTALAKQGECARALSLYEELGPVPSASPTTRYNEAVCRFRTGDERAALAILDALDGARATPTRALLLRARIRASLGEVDRAEARYREAIAAGIPAEVELAGWLAERGEHAAAIDLLWPLVADAADPEVLALAADALVHEGDFERAETATTRLVDIRPDAASWTTHGRVLLRRSEWVAAERAFASALDVEPNTREARVGLRLALEHRATAAFRDGDRDAARKLLTLALEADPSADGAALNLALLALDRGEANRAIELVAPQVERSPSARSRLVLGRAHLQAGDAEAAIRELEAAASDAGAAPAVKRLALSHLAHALATGSPERAVEQVARARELGGDGDESRALLDRAEARAHLALAERAYRRANYEQLARAVGAIDRAALAPANRARAAALELYVVGKRKGLRAALRSLDAIDDADLAPLATGAVGPRAVAHALAIDLGARFIKRAADYRRHLRSHVRALHQAASKSDAVARYVTAWYERLLDWAIDASSAPLAKSLGNDAPSAVRTPVFEHNAIVAAATRGRGWAQLTRAQIARLEKLAPEVPRAWVNLAADANRRGDHAAVLGYLKKIPTAERSRAVTDWIRWEERFHGAR